MEPTAKFSIQCWGCNQSVEMPYSSFEDMQNKTEVLKAQGWRRRMFGGNVNASPWFCSEDCATNSYNAKRAEEWWAKEKFRQEEENRIIPMRLWPILGFAGILIIASLLMPWCN
jgi:hypothetical protein